MTVTSEEARAARREYYRQYRKKNPDKVREANRRYWEKKARESAAEQEESHADDGKAGT